MKHSAIKTVKPKPADEPRLNRSQLEISDQIAAMVAHGKDPMEAAVMVTLDKIVADLTHEEDPHRTYFESLSGKDRAKIRSLRWLADEVQLEMRKAQMPGVWFYEPTFAEYCKEFFLRDVSLDDAVRNAWKALSRRPKLRRRLEQLFYDVIWRRENLSLTIGFCMGLRAYKLGLEQKLFSIAIDKIGDYSVQYPKESDHSKRAGASDQV